MFSVFVFAAAWFKGAHPERFGAMVLIVAYVVSALAPSVKVLGDLLIYDAAADLVLLVIFIWMALKGERWWPFAAAAAMFLTLMVHLAMVLVPELDTRADLSARMGLTLLLVTALLAGVGERWLAGEQAVCKPGEWESRRRRRREVVRLTSAS